MVSFLFSIFSFYSRCFNISMFSNSYCSCYSCNSICSRFRWCIYYRVIRDILLVKCMFFFLYFNMFFILVWW